MNVTQTTQRTQQFAAQLQRRVKYTKGWDVQLISRPDQHLHFRFKCVHDRKYSEDFLPDSLANVPSVKDVADQIHRRAVKWCKGEHIDVTPNTWVGPYYWGDAYTPIKLTIPSLSDQIQQAASLINSQVFAIYGEMILTGAKVGVGSSWSMGNTGNSILNELATVCPGIHTVKRECPGCPSPSTTGPRALSLQIPHLNDTHKWSREKIADWLEVIMTDPDVDLTIKPVKVDA